MFEQATRLKLRFTTSKGSVDVENLWDMKLSDLNELAKGYHKEIKEAEDMDFLDETSKDPKNTRLKFDIVLHILKVKKEEIELAKTIKARKEEHMELLELIKAKKQESLKNLSIEELQARVAAVTKD